MSLNDLLFLEYNIKFNSFNNIFVNKFCLDSREIDKDDVFICVNSGYKYIMDAKKNGAIAVITDQDVSADDLLIIRVKNINETISKIIKYILSIKNVKKIAITGSNGKTTTKELVASVLKTHYKVLSSSGNNNNFLGLANTIFRLNDHDILVFEMGMNHAGEISNLSKILKPDIGIITNIGSAHIGLLGSKKNIFKAKMEILDGNPDMLLYVNGYDHYLKHTKGIKVKTKKMDYEPIFPFLKINYAFAYQIGLKFNIPKSDIFKSFLNFKMYMQRMNIIYHKSTIIIDDTYNASYESIIGGLSYLNSYKKEKIIILGDVLEAGKYSKKLHKKINSYLRKVKDKEVLLIGNYTKYIKGKHFLKHIDLINYLSNIDIKNKVIYLKGSRLMNLELIRDNLLLKF